MDGDTIFSLATGKKHVDLNLLCAFAPIVFAEAMLNAVRKAEPAGGLPAVQSIPFIRIERNLSMTHLVADTLSCLSVEEAANLGISYLPQIIIFGDESYRDDSEMDSDTFIKRLKNSSTLPKTSAPYPSLYNPFLDKLTQTGEPILLISPFKKDERYNPLRRGGRCGITRTQIFALSILIRWDPPWGLS